MQFDELCALFGALRDRVADLEAEVATLKARPPMKGIEAVTSAGAERWRIDAVSSKRIAPFTVADRNRLA